MCASLAWTAFPHIVIRTWRCWSPAQRRWKRAVCIVRTRNSRRVYNTLNARIEGLRPCETNSRARGAIWQKAVFNAVNLKVEKLNVFWPQVPNDSERGPVLGQLGCGANPKPPS
eukprot:TRINITY_DN60490_c0_g1_i1.p1 TRINITY_DN60490_c0_g1~~TRINITY_DN60490_c0_g1_i1.p1  ORF type:complete len:114 (-),score=6.73 TRINITY_DN60490_c0_g1_i1:153-494(-)